MGRGGGEGRSIGLGGRFGGFGFGVVGVFDLGNPSLITKSLSLRNL